MQAICIDLVEIFIEKYNPINFCKFCESLENDIMLRSTYKFSLIFFLQSLGTLGQSRF